MELVSEGSVVNGAIPSSFLSLQIQISVAAASKNIQIFANSNSLFCLIQYPHMGQFAGQWSIISRSQVHCLQQSNCEAKERLGRSGRLAHSDVRYQMFPYLLTGQCAGQ